MHDRIISLRGEVWAHKTSLTPPLFVEVSVLRHVMYLCVRIIDCVSFCDFSSKPGTFKIVFLFFFLFVLSSTSFAINAIYSVIIQFNNLC